jgi:hypothetical protein
MTMIFLHLGDLRIRKCLLQKYYEKYCATNTPLVSWCLGGLRKEEHYVAKL